MSYISKIFTLQKVIISCESTGPYMSNDRRLRSASGLKRNPWLMISIQEQDHELTITDYLLRKWSPSWLLCTGISDDFLGVNRHKSRSVSLVNRMYFLTFLTLLNQISPVAVNTGMVRRMMSTVATLRLRSSLVQLSVSCRFFARRPTRFIP